MRVLTVDPGRRIGAAEWLSGNLIWAGIYRDTWLADVVVIERPFAPPRHARPADLISLALVAGRIAGIAEARGIPVRWMEVAAWKSSVPKRVIRARVRTLLEQSELGAMASTVHDVWDAVGIGLVYLRRATRGVC